MITVNELFSGIGAFRKAFINLGIRKLTPLECWRLMGFTEEDFHKAEKVCSNTQLIKQAGNSIGVPVLEGILRNLIPPEEFAPQRQTPMEWLNEFFGGD